MINECYSCRCSHWGRVGLVLLGDASSGGFDIIGVILQKYFKSRVSIVMSICDITVILIQVASNPFMKNVYGILAIMICTITVNKVLAYGQSQCGNHDYES